MANLKSSKKDIRRTAKRTERNRAAKTFLKSLTRKVEAARASGDAQMGKSAAVACVSAMDKAVKRGIIHQNKANRYKSSVASLVFNVAG
jgi:small subunit ribosomal protein S20